MELQVNSKLCIYDNDRCAWVVGEMKYMEVKSCWNRKELAEIVMGGKSIWVCRVDLITALNNAGNT